MATALNVAGIPLRIRPEFWLITALVAFDRISTPLLLVEWIAVVTVSILLHELGHALAFRAFKRRPAIELHGMGGRTWDLLRAPLSPLQDALVSLAGPAAGLAFGAAIWSATRVLAIDPSSALLSSTIVDLLWVNVGWSLLNLLPMLPLDGGHILRAVVRRDTITYAISLAVAVAAAILAWRTGMTWGAYLAAWFAISNGKALFDRPGGSNQGISSSM